MSSPSNSWSAKCAGFALALAASSPAVARGAEAEPRSDTGAPRASDAARSASPRHLEIAARAIYGDVSVALLGAGVEGAYFLNPHFALGGTVEAFAVDNGADPDYSDPGTLSKGYHGMLSMEYDALDFWVTPFARIAGGLGEYTRIESWQRPKDLELVGQLQVGFVLRGGPIVGRLSVAPTLYGKDSATAYSAAVGARF